MRFYELCLVETREKYDIARGFVVRAVDEDQARYLAAENCGDEGAEAWHSRIQSTCEELTTDGAACVIIRDFKPG